MGLAVRYLSKGKICMIFLGKSKDALLESDSLIDLAELLQELPSHWISRLRLVFLGVGFGWDFWGFPVTPFFFKAKKARWLLGCVRFAGFLDWFSIGVCLVFRFCF